MSKEDVDKAVRDAEQFAAEDAKRKEEVDTRNEADQMVYQTEKILDEMGGKLDGGDKSAIDSALNRVKDALKGTDTQAIKNATEELKKAFYAASEKLYGQAGQAGPGPDMGGAGFGGGAAQGGADDVVDADFEVMDDDNK